ncbi:MAG: tocopherol cyclase family protein [Oscillospiraceae bacterium]|nr:tocopherol cyclase family protein [Oscillospiraceae bacterium]
MSGKFSGYYFKHQKNGRTVAFIPGISDQGAFIQVITDSRSYHFEFSAAAMGKEITIGKCHFSTKGIHIDLPGIQGDIMYSDVTPIKSDIMGPFRFFPMECRHKIVSMRHKLNGSLRAENKIYDFNGGTGYIEGDSGRSFPEKYVWLQTNDFLDGSSVMLSVAEIPFLGLHFEGCICVVLNRETEYRIATYHGAKAVLCENSIILCQGDLRLTADILSYGTGFSLASPHEGKLKDIIKENNNAKVLFKLTSKGKTVCDILSENAAIECFGYPLLPRYSEQ